jgi:cell division septation protein DedD
VQNAMQDDGFHEIQLNGKQLVFLFMAATVVAVVIFLCGVMVGRGVPVQRAGEPSDAPPLAAIDPTAAVQAPPPPAAAATTSSAPISASETLTYPSRLEEPTPPVETLKGPAEPVEVAPAPAPARERATPEPAPARETAAPVPAPERAADPAPAPTAAAALTEPPGKGFVVQVAAVRERNEADIIARRLTTKGYPAFVTTPASGGPVFRVRVGKYDDRREAESVAGRLEKEERFKPWITR